MSKFWTQEEIDTLIRLQADLDWTQIGLTLGRTPESCRLKFQRGLSLLRKSTSYSTFKGQGPTVCVKQPEEGVSASAESGQTSENKETVAYWKKQATSLRKELDDARAHATAEKILAERVESLAPTAYAPAPFHLNPEFKKGASSPQSAVLLFSDTHIGAVVSPEQTLGMGGYNFEIFLRRLQRLEKSVFSILEDHTTTPIEEIVIPILGDMLDGALDHGAEIGQENTMLAQFYQGGHAIAQFLRNLTYLAPLRIYSTVGNHSRWQNQKRMPTKNRNSNFDQLLYLYVKALLRDEPRIVWHMDAQPFATFEVQGYPFYALHGDNIRGGDKMLGVPNHALGRMISTTTQLFSRADKNIPAYYCLGHMHRPIELPHANGEILVNGAFPGIDGYALNEYFNSSRPSQRFFLMHPKFGIAASYKLRLDMGDETPHNYQVPTEFPIV